MQPARRRCDAFGRSRSRRALTPPAAIERPSPFASAATRSAGRIDRIDETPDGAVITDYKSSDVRDQKRADAKARDSLQLQVYALAHQAETGQLPSAVQLHFVESGVVGQRPADARTTRKGARQARRGGRRDPGAEVRAKAVADRLRLLPVSNHLLRERRVISVPEPRRPTDQHAACSSSRRWRGRPSAFVLTTVDPRADSQVVVAGAVLLGAAVALTAGAGAVDCRLRAHAAHCVSAATGCAPARRAALCGLVVTLLVILRAQGALSAADGDFRDRDARARRGDAVGPSLDRTADGSARMSRRPAGPGTEPAATRARGTCVDRRPRSDRLRPTSMAGISRTTCSCRRRFPRTRASG